MEMLCTRVPTNWKRVVFVAIAILITTPPQAWGTDVIVNSNTTSRQTIAANDDTLTNNATIDFTGLAAVNINTRTGVTITNNGTIQSTGARTINALTGTTNLTITNSGTIQTTGASQAINVTADTNFTLTNNAGGVISGLSTAINMQNVGGTINNSGTISTSGTGSTQTLQFSGGTGLTLNNNAGGIISSAGTNSTIRIFQNNTITNSGSIINSNLDAGSSFSIRGNDNTITLKEGSLLVGPITFTSAATSGNKLQIDQGFGQAYFYETSGDGVSSLSLEDLSGNTAVKGSAGSVGLGAQESVDELLGLRAFNLRSALKRYAAAPEIFKDDKLWAEPFSYFSKRGSNSSVLGYETHGYGINFIYPLPQHKLDLMFTIEKSELNIDRDHDISSTHLLAGVNATDFAELGDWKASGFFVTGWSWHNSDREIFTNTTTTGKDNIVANYKSKEIITGAHVSNTFNHKSDRLKRNTWKTELGVTFGYSFIEDYNERKFFSFEERHMVQGSIHVGEQFTSKINDRLTFTIGGELEHRLVLAGREQSYAINGTTVDYKQGSFYESSVAGNMGVNYSLDNNTLAYLHVDNRFSNYTQGTFGASMGIQIKF
jgi:hypothetical protein